MALIQNIHLIRPGNIEDMHLDVHVFNLCATLPLKLQGSTYPIAKAWGK